jgi:hypothetical protein
VSRSPVAVRAAAPNVDVVLLVVLPFAGCVDVTDGGVVLRRGRRPGLDDDPRRASEHPTTGEQSRLVRGESHANKTG